ncbi:hypothetical protein [Pseudonocardia charpentierae]|uniref:hypothetical protein n=1 Tax=Pseudonocardia charpentierae TaxID=3075545 RepID=UPI0037C832CF
MHGLAFAALLGQLDLGRDSRVAVLLGFGLPQLIVVALIMPSLLVLSRTTVYPQSEPCSRDGRTASTTPPRAPTWGLTAASGSRRPADPSRAASPGNIRAVESAMRTCRGPKLSVTCCGRHSTGVSAASRARMSVSRSATAARCASVLAVRWARSAADRSASILPVERGKPQLLLDTRTSSGCSGCRTALWAPDATDQAVTPWLQRVWVHRGGTPSSGHSPRRPSETS